MSGKEAKENGGKLRIIESIVVLVFIVGGIVYGIDYVIAKYHSSLPAGAVPVATSIVVLAAGYSFITILGNNAELPRCKSDSVSCLDGFGEHEHKAAKEV